MTHRHRTTLLSLAMLASVAACDRARQAPGMEAKDLSDDRGAKAGRFLPPADNGADANAAAPADAATNESKP